MLHEHFLFFPSFRLPVLSLYFPIARGKNVDARNEHTYREQLKACTLHLAGDDGSDLKDTVESFIRMGNLLSKLGELSGAIRCFNDASQIECGDTELQFRDFFMVQFTLYLLGKRDLVIHSRAEVDMIHDLIRDRWDELLEEMESSQFSFVCSDLKQWYSSVVIDFPYELCDIFECHYDSIDLLIHSN